jgi:hypothetical protein
MSDDKIDKLLKLEEMRQSREVDLASLTRDIYKAKENKANPDIIGYLLAAGVAVSATLGVVLAISPEARDAVGRLFGLGPKTANPNPFSKAPISAIIVNEQPQQPSNPQFRTPRYELRPKWSFSGTSLDERSLEEKARREEFLKQTPLARPEPRPPSLLERTRGRLTAGTGGGPGRPYSKEELLELDRKLREREGGGK